MQQNLDRFINAQQNDYLQALSEIRSGRKQSHWMWYIFPQVDGLGFSAMSKRYAIQDIREAADYLNHPLLGARLKEISGVLLASPVSDATQIFGHPDDVKLHSSATLFSCVPGVDPIFGQLLHKFFDGRKDPQTLALLK